MNKKCAAMRLTVIRVYVYKVTKINQCHGQEWRTELARAAERVRIKTSRGITAILLRPHFLL